MQLRRRKRGEKYCIFPKLDSNFLTTEDRVVLHLHGTQPISTTLLNTMAFVKWCLNSFMFAFTLSFTLFQQCLKSFPAFSLYASILHRFSINSIHFSFLCLSSNYENSIKIVFQNIILHRKTKQKNKDLKSLWWWLVGNTNLGTVDSMNPEYG